MGTGIDLAAIDNPEHAQAIDNMKDQLLIVLVKRLGGSIEVPVAEIDDTSQDMLSLQLDPVTRVFTFTTSKKS